MAWQCSDSTSEGVSPLVPLSKKLVLFGLKAILAKNQISPKKIEIALFHQKLQFRLKSSVQLFPTLTTLARVHKIMTSEISPTHTELPRTPRTPRTHSLHALDHELDPGGGRAVWGRS
jgi:hypothetical protein